MRHGTLQNACSAVFVSTCCRVISLVFVQAWLLFFKDQIRVSGLSPTQLLQAVEDLKKDFSRNRMEDHWLLPSLSPLLALTAQELERSRDSSSIAETQTADESFSKSLQQSHSEKDASIENYQSKAVRPRSPVQTLSQILVDVEEKSMQLENQLSLLERKISESKNINASTRGRINQLLLRLNSSSCMVQRTCNVESDNERKESNTSILSFDVTGEDLEQARKASYGTLEKGPSRGEEEESQSFQRNLSKATSSSSFQLPETPATVETDVHVVNTYSSTEGAEDAEDISQDQTGEAFQKVYVRKIEAEPQTEEFDQNVPQEEEQVEYQTKVVEERANEDHDRGNKDMEQFEDQMNKFNQELPIAASEEDHVKTNEQAHEEEQKDFGYKVGSGLTTLSDDETKTSDHFEAEGNIAFSEDVKLLKTLSDSMEKTEEEGKENEEESGKYVESGKQQYTGDEDKRLREVEENCERNFHATSNAKENIKHDDQVNRNSICEQYDTHAEEDSNVAVAGEAAPSTNASEMLNVEDLELKHEHCVGVEPEVEKSLDKSESAEALAKLEEAKGEADEAYTTDTAEHTVEDLTNNSLALTKEVSEEELKIQLGECREDLDKATEIATSVVVQQAECGLSPSLDEFAAEVEVEEENENQKRARVDDKAITDDALDHIKTLRREKRSADEGDADGSANSELEQSAFETVKSQNNVKDEITDAQKETIRSDYSDTLCDEDDEETSDEKRNGLDLKTAAQTSLKEFCETQDPHSHRAEGSFDICSSSFGVSKEGSHAVRFHSLDRNSTTIGELQKIEDNEQEQWRNFPLSPALSETLSSLGVIGLPEFEMTHKYHIQSHINTAARVPAVISQPVPLQKQQFRSPPVRRKAFSETEKDTKQPLYQPRFVF